MEQFERDLLKNIAGISGFMPGSVLAYVVMDKE